MVRRWLTSFPERTRIGGKRYDFNTSAESERLKEHCETMSLPDTGGHNLVLGVVQANIVSAYTHLTRLSDDLRLQYQFWQSVDPDKDMSGQLFLMEIEADRCCALPIGTPVQQCARQRAKNLVFDLEEQQPERLASIFQPIPAWLGAAIPTVGMRLPLPYAWCVISGLWRTFIVPCFGTDCSPLNVQWAKLGVEVCRVPVPLVPIPEQTPLLDARFAIEVADMLRDAALQFDPDKPEDQGTLSSFMRACCVLQQYHDQMIPGGILGAIRDFKMASRLSDDPTMSIPNRPSYKAVFVVQTLLCCGVLQSDSSLKEAMERCLLLVLPPVIAEPVKALIREDFLPSKSSISRWRLLLDVAFMQYQREKVLDSHRDGGCVRYLMTDSSPQGGRDYQMLIMASIKTTLLPRLMRVADLLMGISRST